MTYTGAVRLELAPYWSGKSQKTRSYKVNTTNQSKSTPRCAHSGAIALQP